MFIHWQSCIQSIKKKPNEKKCRRECSLNFFLLAFAWDNADVLSRWDKIVNSSVIEIIIKESKKKWRQRFYKWMKMFSLFKLERFTNYDKLQNSFKNINIYKIKGKNKRTRRENEIDFNFMFVCFFVCFVCFSNNFCFCNKKLFQGLNPFDDQKKNTANFLFD
jgi:hypothetical protein